MGQLLTRNRQKGFTALELIIVLIVGFTIISLSASKMGELFSASNTASAISNIFELYTNARALRSTAGYGPNGHNLLQPLVKAGMAPKGLLVNSSEGSAKNEWNGNIAVTVINEGLGFEISYPHVPKHVCVKLAPSIINSGNFSAVKIGTTTLNISESLTSIAIITTCTETKNKNIDMVFRYSD